MSTTLKQYLSAKNEVETSVTNARTLYEQWKVATRENPTNLTKKEIDYMSKAFKNRLLLVKWNCEDLEDLFKVHENELNNLNANELDQAKCFIQECRNEVSLMMDTLEQVESNNKIFNKHGISFPTSTQATQITSMIQSPISKYERLSNNDAEEIQFDKNLLVAANGGDSDGVAIFNNTLYDHFELNDDKQLQKNFIPSQVFNNLSRPETNVYINPNENEIILDMLETEYYNPPAGLQGESRFNYTLRNLLETNRNKVLGMIALIFSFPIIFLIILVI